MGYTVRHGGDTIDGLSAEEALATARALFADGAILLSIHDPDGDPISLRTLDRRVEGAGLVPAAFASGRPTGLACG